jgi:hypothetical protein
LAVFVLAAQFSSSIPRLPGTTIIFVLNLGIAFLLSCVISFFSKIGDDEILERASKTKGKKQLVKAQIDRSERDVPKNNAGGYNKAGKETSIAEKDLAGKKHKTMYRSQVPLVGSKQDEVVPEEPKAAKNPKEEKYKQMEKHEQQHEGFEKEEEEDDVGLPPPRKVFSREGGFY